MPCDPANGKPRIGKVGFDVFNSLGDFGVVFSLLGRIGARVAFVVGAVAARQRFRQEIQVSSHEVSNDGVEDLYARFEILFGFRRWADGDQRGHTTTSANARNDGTEHTVITLVPMSLGSTR